MAEILCLAAGSALLPARSQMALSLGWHIVLACFGMALPAMILVLHRRGLRGDEVALDLAKRWSKVAGVLFAIGAVSGTILAFEMGLLWPGLMERYGDVVGLAFTLEGLSFFTEAIFLGIYVYGWGRLPGRLHSLMLLPVIASGVVGSFFVLSVNSWMNEPTGFRVVDGEVVDVDPVAAILNPAVGVQFVHMFLAAYMVVGFLVAGVYAVGALRGRTDRAHRLGLLVPLAFAAVATPLQPIVGHMAGQRIADEQPVKLAAIEGLAHTESRAPLTLGGVFVDGELRGGIDVPVEGLLSFLAHNDFDAEVVGLDSVPAADRPPVNVVRFAFQVMAGIGSALVVVAGWVVVRWWRTRDLVGSRPLLWALAAAGPLTVVAMEAGWVTTEVGRQPWIVDGYLRTADAVTDAGYIWFTFGALVVVYSLLTVGAVVVVRSMSRRWSTGARDLGPAYGEEGGR